MPASTSRNGRFAPWVERARTTRDRAVADFGDLNARALDWKPGPDRWSIAQCLQHLIASNREYAETFEAIAAGTYRPTVFARIPLLPRLWGPLIRWTMRPGNRMKVPTTSALEPGASDLAAGIVEDFSASVDAHVERIEALGRVDRGGVVVPSPFAAFVCYSLDDAVAISVIHLERHRVQAVRVMEAPGFPGGEPA